MTVGGKIGIVLWVLTGLLALRVAADAPASRGWSVLQEGNEIRMFYGAGRDVAQYAVLYTSDSFFRLNAGPASGWGTSVILLPCYWSGERYFHGAPVTVTWKEKGRELRIRLNGEMGDLRVTVEVVLESPRPDRTVARVAVQTEGTLGLDPRPGEAFKLVNLSSMRISSARWDTREIGVDGQAFQIPASGWIVPVQPPIIAPRFAALGGTSDWKKEATSIGIELDQPRQIAAWVSPSEDPNDDNVGVWAAADTVPTHWSYTITATR